MNTRARPRPGFTIVELLVAMALIVLIMAVLSEAFVSGLNTFSRLKSIGDMQERMRSASVKLRYDLLARHFDGDRKLSDQSQFWVNPGRPMQGFFRIQGARPIFEGTDGNVIPSWRTSPNSSLPTLTGVSGLPVLHFGLSLTTSRNTAKQRLDFLTSRVPATPFPNPTFQPPLDQEGPPDFRLAGTMNSPWAEVAYFLTPSLDPSTGQQQYAGNNPLFALHRRQRLCVVPGSPANNGTVAGALWGQYPEVSCAPSVRTDLTQPLRFNSEFDITQPGNRSMMDATGSYSSPAAIGFGPGEDPNLAGDDLLVADVISFEIKVLTAAAVQQATQQGLIADFQDINDVPVAPAPAPFAPAYPFGWYDTADQSIQPQFLPILAIKVVIRVWDAKSNLTRQVTVIQEM
jgi:prepilin-type N-terminal cleavage/methylation domain-containing protein